jgi:nucleoside-diphosphate-sugar epimerase
VRPSTDLTPLRRIAGPERIASLEFCNGSLNRMDWAEDALCQCDVVYHVAAALTGGTAVLVANNVVATRELIRRAAEARVSRFVLVSSMGVYGTNRLRAGDVLDEQCPLDSRPHLRDPYTFSKVLQERAATEESRQAGLPLVIVRPGVIYGPGRSCITGRMGLTFGKWLIKMGGRQHLPYSYVDNVARAVALAGTAHGVEGQAFNIIDDDLPRAKELLRDYQKQVGGIRVIPIPHWAIGMVSMLCEKYHARSLGQVPAVLTRYKSSAMWKPLRYANSRAKSQLGWRPEVGFDEGLRRSFAHLREQRQTADLAR